MKKKSFKSHKHIAHWQFLTWVLFCSNTTQIGTIEMVSFALTPRYFAYRHSHTLPVEEELGRGGGGGGGGWGWVGGQEAMSS